MFDGTGKPMFYWSICLSTTNISLDNESGLSQGIKIFVRLIANKRAVLCTLDETRLKWKLKLSNKNAAIVFNLNQHCLI